MPTDKRATKVRLDLLLVARGLVESREQARRLIMAGEVTVDGQLFDKPGQAVREDAEVQVRTPLPYVSRGGVKLAAALDAFAVDVAGLVAVDVGASTGGFTDCLLQHGAAKVIGIDVGHGQLHPGMATDPRVESHEGVNARALEKSALAGRQFDFITTDVSFISLTLILPQLPHFLTRLGDLLLLVKPQFEVGPEHIGKGGIVTDAALYPAVRTKLTACCTENHLAVLDWFDSPITGTDGNHEFFIHAKHEQD
jgi:23S rRNA (cytidine1920-2'-O)/16S rRNA (cytidine1409-2'-O)-methyltransferase